jgi:hypothetical protein
MLRGSAFGLSRMTTAALEKILGELEQDRLLSAPDQLRRRVESLDRLETGLILAPEHGDERAIALHRRGEAMVAELEEANRALYQSVRGEIRQGRGAAALSAWSRELIGRYVSGEGYDYLDALVSGVLQLDEPDVEGVAPGSELVFYQPTPARHIFDFIHRAKPDERDVLIDIGSGLGHVSLLSAICTPARCGGIELEGAYVESARKSAQALNIRNATFIRGDARSVDLSLGTVFYLYTPFTGSVLRHVLDRLKREAATRDIRLCTLGPCTKTIGMEAWLETDGEPREDRVAIFRPR